MSTDLSYEQSARYYDAAYLTVPTLGPDAAFYRTIATECGGPVLELGCGTGRVLLPIAERGFACVGIDRSPAMLAQFRAKPGAETVELSCASMESFDLNGRKFRLVYSAFSAFQHLETVAEQLACLARVRAHLEPGGMFAFDVFNPRLEAMAVASEPESLDLTFTYNGNAVKRFSAVTRDRATQLIQVTMRYKEDPAGDPGLIVKFSMRWFWRYEIEHLMHRAGFGDVVIYGNFDRGLVTSTSPALVVVARL